MHLTLLLIKNVSIEEDNREFQRLIEFKLQEGETAKDGSFDTSRGLLTCLVFTLIISVPGDSHTIRKLF